MYLYKSVSLSKALKHNRKNLKDFLQLGDTRISEVMGPRKTWEDGVR